MVAVVLRDPNAERVRIGRCNRGRQITYRCGVVGAQDKSGGSEYQNAGDGQTQNQALPARVAEASSHSNSSSREFPNPGLQLLSHTQRSPRQILVV